MDTAETGKILVLSGLLLILLGAVFLLSGKIPFLERLPGDIHIQKPGFNLHIPIVTCFVLSILLTVILNFFLKR